MKNKEEDFIRDNPVIGEKHTRILSKTKRKKEVSLKYFKYIRPKEEEKNDPYFSKIINRRVRNEIGSSHYPLFTSPSPQKTLKNRQKSSK